MLTLVITLSGVAGPQNCTQCDHQCQSVTLAAGAQTRIATMELALGAQTSWVVILAHYDIVITFLLLNYHS